MDKGIHAIYNTQYHIVWAPRYRRKLLVNGVKEYLEKLFTNMEGIDEDIEVRKVNVQIDHVHIVIVIPPRVSVTSVKCPECSYTTIVMSQGEDLKKKGMSPNIIS